MPNPSKPGFIRYRTTWLAYIMLAYMSYAPSTIGPMMPFLRSELNLSYTLGGFLLSISASGMVLAGLIGDRMARVFGRRAVFWGGAVGASFGAVFLALSRTVMISLPAVFIMGLSAGLVQVMIQAILVDLHGESRTVALTEANIAASLSTCLAPLIVVEFQRLGLGWRSGLYLVVLFLLIIISQFWLSPIPNPNPINSTNRRVSQDKLPRVFWLFWIIVFLVVSIEWSLMVWGADFLVSVIGLSKINASMTMSGFLGAYVLGRVIGSRLTRFMQGHIILFISLGVTLVSFPLFWLSRTPLLNLIGLLFAGMGVANLYPLAMSLAIGIDSRQANLASARISFGAGLAIFVAPLSLGNLADRLGIQNAYGIVVLLIGLAIVITYVAMRVNSGILATKEIQS
jgi:fucose permease